MALLLHDKLRTDEARMLVSGLGEKPDYAPFYALRAQWMKDDPAAVERDLRKAMALDPVAWRYPKLLAQHLVGRGEHARALDVAESYVKTGKPSFIMDMLHAKTLLLNKQYRACDERLAKMNIIPFEGATEGRALYWEAKMMQAIEALGRKRPKEALKFMEAAGLWPENLGVGKPYDADIDIRLEQFLTAECLEALGRRNEAEALRSHITDFKPEIQNTIANFQPVNHLVVRWVRERTGSVSEWDVWMKKQEERYPEHIKAFEWVRAMAAGNGTAQSPDNAWARVMVAYQSLNSRR
jgi:hypothetical protein